MDDLVLGRLQQLMTIREGVENLTAPLPWTPAADWVDEGTHLLLLLDVPGVNPESLALSEEGETVTVSGERPAPSALLSSERPQGSFTRTLTVPEDILPQTAQAQLLGGVLSVRFEKRHPTIDVSSRSADEQHPQGEESQGNG